MGTGKITILISAALIGLVAVLFLAIRNKSGTALIQEHRLVIEKTWDLPPELREISGFEFIDGERIAAVQDESGQIFIYNLQTGQTEKRIPFAGKGDYEGIALARDTAYVLRSDGSVFRIRNYLAEPAVDHISTFLDAANDTEGILYDEASGDLLIVVKEADPFSEAYKGIYKMNLEEMDLEKDAAYRIVSPNPEEEYFPSEIQIDPSGRLLVLDGENPRLMLMGSGTQKEVIVLDSEKFPQPEGLGFDTAGNLYISNEGSPATLHRVSLPNE